MIFTQNSDNMIRQFMLQNPDHLDPFKALKSLLLGNYTAKQIRDRWNNKLNPHFDHSDFSFHEKLYINNFVNNRQGNNKIPWKNCQEAMERDFGKPRSREKIKNYYYSNERSLARRQLALAQAGSATPIEPYFEPMEGYDKNCLTMLDWKTTFLY